MRMLSEHDGSTPLATLCGHIQLLSTVDSVDGAHLDQLRAALEASLDALEHAAELTEPEHDAMRLLAIRDHVESHLCAAADAASAGVRPEVSAKLLRRAAKQLPV
ncbi:MAG TPA: hypothetical protein VJM33_05420, partial [Microthrixaceae bacterium]|nr:hypothetical protein [Microthrixaceae bacterium]